MAPVGMPISEIVAQCGGLKSTPARIVMGGPMMGRAINDIHAPVTKGTSGVLLLTEDELPNPKASACVRCGRCIGACPMSLTPLDMVAELKADNFAKAAEMGVMDCLLCGSCAYVCPAAIPLTQYFDWGKQEIGKIRLSEQKTARTCLNSAARRERMEREAAEKEAAKAAKPPAVGHPAVAAHHHQRSQHDDFTCPHAHEGISIKSVMFKVNLALVPALLLGILQFGMPALFLVVTTVISALLCEIIAMKLNPRAQGEINDGAAILTALILAMSLPPHAPLWLGALGAAFAIFFGKQVYGGLGQNLFNPAMLARVVLLISFPVEMTKWITPSAFYDGVWYKMGLMVFPEPPL